VLVGNENVVDVDGLAHEGAGLGVSLGGFKKVGADSGAKVFGLADVDDHSVGVLVEVHTGLGGEKADFLDEIHEGCGARASISRIPVEAKGIIWVFRNANLTAPGKKYMVEGVKRFSIYEI
jgi:hypothetical protein